MDDQPSALEDGFDAAAVCEDGELNSRDELMETSELDISDNESTANDCSGSVHNGSSRRSSVESFQEYDLNFSDQILNISDSVSHLEDHSNVFLAEAQLTIEYADDIFRLNRFKEIKFMRRINKQCQVMQNRRCILVNWLIKVSQELRFGGDTIFIAVTLLDRFLDSTLIALECLQLLAVCSLFVAAKMEELAVPSISSLVSLCASAYKSDYFRKMESLLLSTLQFELFSPTSNFFVTYIALKSCHYAPIDKHTLYIARHVLEKCLASYKISQILPSQQAAAALAFSYHYVYFPNMMYGEDEQNFSSTNCTKNIIEMLYGVNAPSSGLMWTFREIFCYEEFKQINLCFLMMTEHMKPFLPLRVNINKEIISCPADDPSQQQRKIALPSAPRSSSRDHDNGGACECRQRPALNYNYNCTCMAEGSHGNATDENNLQNDRSLQGTSSAKRRKNSTLSVDSTNANVNLLFPKSIIT